MAYFVWILSALWLGVVTSISPCPLATNIAAITYLARKKTHQQHALAGAFYYTMGRITAYAGIALVLSLGLASLPVVSDFLRNGVKPFVGPILILAGMSITGLLPFSFDFRVGSPSTMKMLAGWGWLGEFLIGLLFALSFCPVSAGLFFGSVLPMALGSPIPMLLILSYGTGTALPVAVVAITLVLSVDRATRLLGKIQKAQKSMTLITGSILILVGIYLIVELVRPVG